MTGRDPYRPPLLRRQWNRLNRAAAARYYPRSNGDAVLIGPGCFASTDAEVINWNGENYYRRHGEEGDE